MVGSLCNSAHNQTAATGEGSEGIAIQGGVGVSGKAKECKYADLKPETNLASKGHQMGKSKAERPFPKQSECNRLARRMDSGITRKKGKVFLCCLCTKPLELAFLLLYLYGIFKLYPW